MRALTCRVVVLAVACALGGCAGGGGGNGDGGGGQPACKPPATPTVSFANNIQPIFNRSCALTGCHAPGSLGGNLDLSAGNSYRQIVNHASFQQPRKKRVMPGDPDASYLVQKLEGAP